MLKQFVPEDMPVFTDNIDPSSSQNLHWGGLRGAYHTNPFYHEYDYTGKQLLMKQLSQKYQYMIIK